ncbi:MAG: hypothetical protein ACYC6X_01175 [Minisyncoccota bacterium]
MEPQIPLTKKERKELKRQEKLEEKDAAIQNRNTKKIIRRIGWSTFGIAVIVGLVWLVASQPKTPESDIASRSGLHWHPELAIYVKGVKQDLPANLGIVGSSMAPVHTHGADGVIHLEFQGLVRKSDITLGQFFKSWGKDMRSFGTNLKMTVNGKENTEYENYIMQDKDKIELRFE